MRAGPFGMTALRGVGAAGSGWGRKGPQGEFPGWKTILPTVIGKGLRVKK
jgi:hypothetical protein